MRSALPTPAYMHIHRVFRGLMCKTQEGPFSHHSTYTHNGHFSISCCLQMAVLCSFTKSLTRLVCMASLRETWALPSRCRRCTHLGRQMQARSKASPCAWRPCACSKVVTHMLRMRQETRVLAPPDAATHWAAIAVLLAAGSVAPAVRLVCAGHQRGALAHYALEALPGSPPAGAPPVPAAHQGPAQACLPQGQPPAPAPAPGAPATDELWQPRGQGSALGFTEEEPPGRPGGTTGAGTAAAARALHVRLEGCSAAGAAVVALALLTELVARRVGGGGGDGLQLRITTGAPQLWCCSEASAWLGRWLVCKVVPRVAVDWVQQRCRRRCWRSWGPAAPSCTVLVG